MKMLRPIALALALIAATLAPAMAATGPVTEEEAHAIGVDAYIYFYPIVTMDVTRKQLTNEEPKPGGIEVRRCGFCLGGETTAARNIRSPSEGRNYRRYLSVTYAAVGSPYKPQICATCGPLVL
jgi:hypothetical protein